MNTERTRNTSTGNDRSRGTDDVRAEERHGVAASDSSDHDQDRSRRLTRGRYRSYAGLHTNEAHEHRRGQDSWRGSERDHQRGPQRYEDRAYPGYFHPDTGSRGSQTRTAEERYSSTGSRGGRGRFGGYGDQHFDGGDRDEGMRGFRGERSGQGWYDDHGGRDRGHYRGDRDERAYTPTRNFDRREDAEGGSYAGDRSDRYRDADGTWNDRRGSHASDDRGNGPHGTTRFDQRDEEREHPRGRGGVPTGYNATGGPRPWRSTELTYRQEREGPREPVHTDRFFDRGDYF